MKSLYTKCDVRFLVYFYVQDSVIIYRTLILCIIYNNVLFIFVFLCILLVFF